MNALLTPEALEDFDMAFVVKFVIHFEQFKCSCFSEHDLAVNIEFALKQGDRILGVEAV